MKNLFLTSNKWKYFNAETEIKAYNLKKSSLFKHLFSVTIILFRTVFPVIYMKRNIPVTDEKELSLFTKYVKNGFMN
jgi:hypothetical protein